MIHFHVFAGIHLIFAFGDYQGSTNEGVDPVSQREIREDTIGLGSFEYIESGPQSQTFGVHKKFL